MKKSRVIITLIIVVALCCTYSATAFADYQPNSISINTDYPDFVLVYSGENHYVPYNTVVSQYYNSTHYTVWYAQEGLRDYAEYFNYSTMNPGKPDGEFGPNTRRAFINFQSHWGLVPDGEVGNNTWAELEACLHNINGYVYD